MNAFPQRLGHWPISGLTERELIIVGEQGLGDVIFFLRFLPALKDRVSAIFLDIDTRLHEIVRSCSELSWVQFSSAATMPKNPVTLPVGDLPGLFGPTSFVPPLRFRPSESRLLAASERLATLGPAPYIGVTWEAGSKPLVGSRAGVDFFKRVSPALLGESLRTRKGTFVILQRNPEACDVSEFIQALSRTAWDCSDINGDLSAALAMLALLNEYIGVSNTNLHLRAGVTSSGEHQTTILACHPPEWRWGHHGHESPWFPGIRVLRELAASGRPDTWSTALSQL
jgi:hypothetical protein